jgi:tetratricopeptide (TPR) repeat protein
MPRIALAFQEYAVKLDDKDATLWLNLGTLRRTTGALGPAEAAFKSAIALDAANAMAHYNLGAAYDADKHYDEAVEEYRRALVLDPELADPRKNPQVVNNERLLAVKLQIYSEQAGSLGLPLLQMQKNEPKPKPEPEKTPDKK